MSETSHSAGVHQNQPLALKMYLHQLKLISSHYLITNAILTACQVYEKVHSTVSTPFAQSIIYITPKHKRHANYVRDESWEKVMRSLSSQPIVLRLVFFPLLEVLLRSFVWVFLFSFFFFAITETWTTRALQTCGGQRKCRTWVPP